MLFSFAKLPTNVRSMVKEAKQTFLSRLTRSIPFFDSFTSWLRSSSFAVGEPTRIVLIFISYKGQFWPRGGPMALKGPEHDLHLLLKKYNYRHGDSSSRIQVLTDVDLEYTDSKGVTQKVAAITPTRDNIKRVLTSTATCLTRKDKLLVWYGGHAKPRDINVDTEDYDLASYLLPVDVEKPIQGGEMRTWLTENVNTKPPILVVLDTCQSENVLGLPIKYDRVDDNLISEGKKVKGITSNLMVIGAARMTQYANSLGFQQTSEIHGVLTWFLLQALDDPNGLSLEELTKTLYSNVSIHWDQTPLITTAKPLREKRLAI